MQPTYPPVPRFSVRRWLVAGLLALLAVAVACSWLLAVYLLDGRGLLGAIRLDLQTGRASQMQTVQSALARSTSLSPHVEMLTIYATPEFFDIANRQAKGIPYDPATSFIFLVNEDTHMDELPLAAPPVRLRIGDRIIQAENLELLQYSDHHKVSIATFPRADAVGPLLDGEATLTLLAPAVTMTSAGRSYSETDTVAVTWDLPIVYPEGALSGESLPFGTVLAIAMGLLATVMTPCLVQLLAFYLSSLTGMSAESLEGIQVERAVRARLMQTAFGFVLGYTVLFTSAGALAGFAGETLQATWNVWTRPLAITAGSAIVLMGLWMAARARAPLVCRLPLANRAAVHRGGLVQSTLLGLGFAVGCSTCFGGALIATLLLYVGTLGSALQGAIILFFFSLGIGIPFLIAAGLLTQVMPMVQRVQRAAPIVGLVSSAIVIAFGVLMITDRFHLISMWLAPILGLA